MCRLNNISKLRFLWYLHNKHVNYSGILNVSIGQKPLFHFKLALFMINGNVIFFNDEGNLTVPGFIKGQNSKSGLIFAH